MSFNNNQNQKPINNGSNKKNSINFNNVIKNLSASPNAKPWYKKKASIIAMSSTLGVGVLATAIAVPVVLMSQSNSTIPPKDPITIETFNAYPVAEKLDLFNSIMANSANNTKIIKHILTDGGILNFFNDNISIPNNANQTYQNGVNNIRTFLTSYKVTPPHTGLTVQESDFFSIKGVGVSQNVENMYFSQQVNSSNILIFYVYSPIKIWVNNITIKADYSISIDISSLTNDDLAFINIINTDASSVNLLYKQTLIYNDLNLFPGMQEYVKSTILNIK